MNARFNVALATLLAVFTLLLAGCRNGKKGGDQTLRIGASPVPHAAILEQVKPALAREGITLEIVEMTDYVQPNIALVEKDLDANFFQHQPYLDSFNRERHENLVTLTKVHVEPLGVYSKKLKALSDLAPGATLAIPNDPTNSARALKLLEKAGVLRLASNTEPTVADVLSDAKTPKLRELDGAQLPRALEDVDAAIINTNYALEAGLDPTRDALVREDASSPYANVLVTRPERSGDLRLKSLIRELTSDSTRRFIEERFRGSLIPAF